MVLLVPSPPVTGFDYAWQHPSPSALLTAGAKFACRYLSNDPSKNLTLAEAQELAALGLAIVANWETTATEAENGYVAGVSDANMALREAAACGMPADRPIYFSVDEPTTVGPNVAAYFRGVAYVLGLERTGGYGGIQVIKGLFDAGLITWGWQTYAWSGTPTQWDPRAQLRQVQNELPVGGVLVDLDHGMTSDFGQWTPSGGDSMSQADVDAINAHTDAWGKLIGARLDQLDAADKQQAAALTVLYAAQKRDANGNLIPVDPTHTGIGDLARALGVLPDRISSAVVSHVSNAQIDQAALLAAIRQVLVDELAGTTITITPKAV